MPVFSPPIANDLPTVLPETTGLPRLLFRHFQGRARGRTVVKVGDAYVTYDTPYAELVEGLTEGVDYFLGGHLYLVSEAVANDLIADGYDVDLQSTWGSHTGTTWGSHEDEMWGSL